MIASVCRAQYAITPFAGINSTRMSDAYGYGYNKGGNFGIVGFEAECWKRPTTHRALHLSLLTGVSYLKNGFYSSDNLSFSSILYIHQITDLRTTYWQVPVVLRLNWQPFPLIEDWMLFVGAGISNNLLTKATLAEQYTQVALSDDILAPPVTVHYEDSRDVTKFAAHYYLFGRIETGVKFRRLQLTYRVSFSMQDMYYKGVETVWSIPAKDSQYINTHQLSGKSKEKYSELTLGYRFVKD
jgi:hypothetical protein